MKATLKAEMAEQPKLNNGMWELGGAGWGETMNMVPAVSGHSLAARCPIGNYGDQALSVDDVELLITEIYLERSQLDDGAYGKWFWLVVFS